MRIFSLLALVFFLPVFAHAAVVINEIAWMGIAANANAEWIELANTGSMQVDLSGWKITSSTGSPTITLTGIISGNGYYLLERNTSGATIGVAPDQSPYTGALVNSGATLTLTDGSGTQIDQVIGGTNWTNVGGNTTHYDTAQRTASNWETAAATPRAINAGVSPPPADPSPPPADSSTTTTPTTGSSGSPAEYLPIPALHIVTSGDRTVSSGAETAFTAVVYDGKGNKRDDAMVTWSFGDGMRKTGASVFHEYYDPGEYLAVVHATTADGGDALHEIVVTVKDASIRIASISARGITLMNSDSRTLDLSLWRLSAGGQEFKIPADTHILAGHTILFPSQVIELPAADSAFLLYPSGEVAATYPPVQVMQPSASPASFNQVQAARLDEAPARQGEPVISTATNIQTHDEGVRAPAATTKLAAAGAALPSVPKKANGLLNSPWTLSLLGVIAVAGGAFIFL